MTDLSSYLDTAKGERSIDAVVAKAAAAGHDINRATVARYVGGQGAKNPPDSVLRALAAGLDLDIRDLRELAGKPRGELGPYVPVDEAARLSEEQRRAIDTLIKAIVAAPAEVETADDKADRRERTEPKVPSLAARRRAAGLPPLPDPHGEDLDALPDEREEQGPQQGGRQLPAAARRTDRP